MDLLQNIDEKAIVECSKKKRGRPLKYAQNYAPPNNEALKVSTKQPEIITTLRITKAEVDKINVMNGDECIPNKKESDEIIVKSEQPEESLFDMSLTNNNDVKKKISIQKLIKENAELKELLSKKTNTFQTSIIHYNVGFIDDENREIKPENFKNICCGYCHEPFENLPVFIPIKKKNNIYVKMGGGFTFSFCSFSCAHSYNETLRDGENLNRQMLLKQYFYEIFKDKNIDDVNITCAPPLVFLKKLGGSLTIEEWREKASIVGKEYIIQYPPFISSNYFIDEIYDNEKMHASCFINNNPCGFKSNKN